MKIKYERPEDSFIYFEKDGVEIMVEQLDDRSRKWLTGKLERPFGRGINLQWDVKDVKNLYAHVLKTSPNSIYLELEEKSYRCGEKSVKQTQFIVQDPDGYLIRFCS